MKLAIKIGGSVLENEDSYRLQAKRLEQIVQDYSPSKIYVVVSAKRGETDRLIGEVSNPKDEEKLKKALYGECEFPEYNNPGIATRLLQGDIESAHKLQQYLPNAGIIVQDSYFPIIANSSYLNGDIDLEESLHRIPYLARSEHIVIIPGFGAVDINGDKVLLGRNSSDLVAAMVARLANVDRLVYLKDVDGVYRNFGQNNQEIIPELNYQEAKKINLAQVLDKRALEILEGSRIEIVIGHHAHSHELVRPNSQYGTRIKMDMGNGNS